MTDLETLFPGREISAGGEKLTLQPFTFGQLPKAAKLLQPISTSMSDTGVFSVNNIGGEVQFGLAPDWPVRIVDLLASGGDGLLDFIAFAANKPREWVDKLGADDGVALTKALMEVNADFFVRRVLPMLGLVPAAAPSDGANSSVSSSEPATVDRTSTDTPSDKSSSTSEVPSEAVAA